jgi:hypothetical protein
MTEEHNALEENTTWELVNPPPNRKVLKGKWVYKIKRGPNRDIPHHKARWVC